MGPYQVLRARPRDPTELEGWLSSLGYLTLPADIEAIAPYIRRGYTVVAIRVFVQNTHERALSPIALTWPGDELRLPAALGAPGGASPPSTIYIAGPGRYEFPGATVDFAYRTDSGAEGFLTKNELALAAHRDPDRDPVAVRVVGDREVRPIIDEYRTVRVAARSCGCGGDDGDDGGGCGECGSARRAGNPILLVIAAAIALRRRRRRR